MIGFDIGGTKCAVSVGEYVSGTFEITAKEAIPTDLSKGKYYYFVKIIVDGAAASESDVAVVTVS